MTSLPLALGLTVALYAPVAFAQGSGSDPAPLEGAQVVFLGEVHDNPAHHVRQAEVVADLQPAAIVFEMLTSDQAARITPEMVGDVELMAEVLEWDNSGWPDFAMYYPIFASAPEAAWFGAALPREEARAAQDQPLARIFGDSAGFYGLDEPLPSEQQLMREEMQMAAHCNAMPVNMLSVMVGIQRLRDARLAETALEALSIHDGPIVVITGNGHARADWGAPALLRRAAPEVRVATLGQGEAGSGAPAGIFDLVEESAGVDREDPCAAFDTPEPPAN